jgi:hypothetical protein
VEKKEKKEENREKQKQKTPCYCIAQVVKRPVSKCQPFQRTTYRFTLPGFSTNAMPLCRSTICHNFMLLTTDRQKDHVVVAAGRQFFFFKFENTHIYVCFLKLH